MSSLQLENLPLGPDEIRPMTAAYEQALHILAWSAEPIL
jgi:hypothetical protein